MFYMDLQFFDVILADAVPDELEFLFKNYEMVIYMTRGW